MMKSIGYAALAALSMILFVDAANAGVLAAAVREQYATNPNTSYSLIPLDDSSNTSVSFSTASTQTVAISFSADCASASNGQAVYVDILVDGYSASGTSVTLSRLCLDTYLSSHTRNVFATVGAGSHTVQVASYTSSGTGKIRRSVLLVQN